MDNRAFLIQTDLTDIDFVDLPDIPPMSVWKKFIGISEKPDHTVPFGEIDTFQKTWLSLLAANGVRPEDTLLLNVGGDSSGSWIRSRVQDLSNVWMSGLPQQVEIECAILLPDKSSVIGITAEEGDEYWFFKREL